MTQPTIPADAAFLRQPAPRPTVDSMVVQDGKILLIRRKNPPPGWALPGGFVDLGESCEHAVIRETLEETGLVVTELAQFHTYSRPDRDPRLQTVGIIYAARTRGKPVAADDATAARFFGYHELPDQIPFDHREIIEDFYAGKYPLVWFPADQVTA